MLVTVLLWCCFSTFTFASLAMLRMDSALSKLLLVRGVGLVDDGEGEAVVVVVEVELAGLMLRVGRVLALSALGVEGVVVVLLALS